MKQFLTFLAAVLLTATTVAQVGINIETPDASAALDITSTTGGLLVPRMTAAERDAITSPSQGLMIFCTDCASGQGELQNKLASGWTNIMGGDANDILGDANDILVVTSVTDKIWMDRNLGATQVATSSTDEASYGDLYQWGRNSDGHQITTSATTTGAVTSGSEGSNFIINPNGNGDWLTIQDDTRWNGLTKGTHDPCPSGFRVPTEAEWNDERNTWSNASGSYNSPLKLPVAGYRGYTNGVPVNVGSNGYYWSSSVIGTSARYLYFNSSEAGMYNNVRARGLSVRCIKE